MPYNPQCSCRVKAFQSPRQLGLIIRIGSGHARIRGGKGAEGPVSHRDGPFLPPTGRDVSSILSGSSGGLRVPLSCMQVTRPVHRRGSPSGSSPSREELPFLPSGAQRVGYELSKPRRKRGCKEVLSRNVCSALAIVSGAPAQRSPYQAPDLPLTTSLAW